MCAAFCELNCIDAQPWVTHWMAMPRSENLPASARLIVGPSTARIVASRALLSRHDKRVWPEVVPRFEMEWVEHAHVPQQEEDERLDEDGVYIREIRVIRG